MIKSSLFLFLVLIVLCTVVTASAQGPPYTPKTGTPERKAIIDALRAPVEAKLKQKVVFQVDHLKAQSGWVFLRGIPRQPTRAPIDYRGTPYQSAKESGAFDDWICALLKNEAGKWRVVVFVIGATDVVYTGWDDKYKAPPAIFK
jgi:hypothetical protein